MGVQGSSQSVQVTAPSGFFKVARCQVRPQLGDLAHLNVTTYTVRGPIRLVAELVGDQHHVSLTLPPDCAGELLLPAEIGTNLQPLAEHHPLGLSMFRLDPGGTHHFSLLSMK